MLVRVVFALELELSDALRKQLVRTDLIIETVADSNGDGLKYAWDNLAQQNCDLIVVSDKRIPLPQGDALRMLFSLPDAPGLVVLSRDIDPTRRAELVAAGCESVLDEALNPTLLAEALESVIAHRRDTVSQRLLNRRLTKRARLNDFSSRSPAMRVFVEMVQRVINAEVSLLLLGETGVGKERLANAIHGESRRSSGPFVAINCGALPETLLESELFGHERGAFTGATQSRRGCFEVAHGGTLFLDEIGELPHHLQVKLLRVLQDGEVRRLGAERAIHVDVRIMAATNRDLSREVDDGRFRQDLYYRLSVVSLTIPPLRERKEDIPELIENYLDYLRPQLRSHVCDVSESARAALINYTWPGNVRELVNVIERAMILCPGEAIMTADLPPVIADNPLLRVATLNPADQPNGEADEVPEQWLEKPWREVRQVVLEQTERVYLKGLLRKTGGRIGETAKLAGMQDRSLFDKMRYYGLRKEDFRVSPDTVPVCKKANGSRQTVER